MQLLTYFYCFGSTICFLDGLDENKFKKLVSTFDIAHDIANTATQYKFYILK